MAGLLYSRRCLFIIGGISVLTLIVIMILVAILCNGGKKYGFFFQPKIGSEDTLIHFKTGRNGNWKKYTQILDKFLEPYEHQVGDHVINCSWDKIPKKDEVCKINWDFQGGDCTKEKHFGFEDGRPCVFLYPKMEDGWKPEFYTATDYLPEDMPQHIKNDITNTRNDSIVKEIVWISCEGKDCLDQENIGNLYFYPTKGYLGYNFPPKRKTSGYLDPIVAVAMYNLKSGLVISVKCVLWAKNIPDDQREIDFHVMID